MKDAQGHGSDSRGGAAPAAHQAGVSRVGGWQTHVGSYSLEANHVGQPVGQPIVTQHSNPVDALRELHGAIGRDAGGGIGRGGTYHIVSPGGSTLSMNAAYKHVFGEDAKSTPRGYSYPKLGKGFSARR